MLAGGTTIKWNGVEFKLPPPWFRLGKTEQVPGTVTFFRIGHYYSVAHGSKNEFRRANTERQMESGEKYTKIECIETRSGWGFDYEGRQADVTEAIAILENSS